MLQQICSTNTDATKFQASFGYSEVRWHTRPKGVAQRPPVVRQAARRKQGNRHTMTSATADRRRSDLAWQPIFGVHPKLGGAGLQFHPKLQRHQQEARLD